MLFALIFIIIMGYLLKVVIYKAFTDEDAPKVKSKKSKRKRWNKPDDFDVFDNYHNSAGYSNFPGNKWN